MLIVLNVPSWSWSAIAIEMDGAVDHVSSITVRTVLVHVGLSCGSVGTAS
jgi:hypothetical protein